MNDLGTKEQNTGNLEKLKNLTVTVYICQILAFALVGFPLLVGVAINFINRNEVQGTWLQSHFDWQIKTVWMTLAGFALSGLAFSLGLEIGLFILIPTLILLVYRIVIGWTTLAANQPIKNINA
ncbi:DUF4870 family protein [Methylovulum miyakonense]|uniref:DUF4870 family protein n=1 Tax=Methylovulum miyakonense TaxID=645578 RepID=UPI00036ADC3E|nr:hypothetical protein [Methylovulum miyakonense]